MNDDKNRTYCWDCMTEVTDAMDAHTDHDTTKYGGRLTFTEDWF